MSERPLKIGISGSYGRLNLGDEAILEMILKQIRESVDSEIIVFTMDREDTISRHEVENAVAIRTMTREEARREVEKLDLLIVGGGGILYDDEVKLFMREVSLAFDADIPVFVYAVSAGPLLNSDNRKMLAEHLNRVAAITVRDRQAMKLLEEIGVDQPITLTADPALLLEPGEIPENSMLREGLDGDRHLVGFSVREPGPAAPDITVEHYHAILANAADFMVARFGAKIFFVPMEIKNDSQHSHAIISQMQYAQEATVLKGSYTPSQLLTFIGKFDFCVGMRLHFLIFSALRGVPFAALPYATKIEGFLQEMEMPMPPLREVTTGELIAYIDKRWDLRGQLRDKISGRINDLREQARLTNRILMDVISGTREKIIH